MIDKTSLFLDGMVNERASGIGDRDGDGDGDGKGMILSLRSYGGNSDDERYDMV